MSASTEPVEPSFSVNPLQAFVNYDHARRAAKSAGVVALLFAALGGYALARLVLSGAAARMTILMLTPGTLLTVAMAVLGWGILVRPGPWKTCGLLAFVVYDIIRVLLGGSNFNLLFFATLVVLCAALIVCVRSFRAALAMKALRAIVDLDVF